jgi:predicted PhzF superfamily epimerase YddE/YHI9
MADPIPYWHVDAFAERLFTGNQAGVLLLDRWPDDATLAAIGAENLFAETAFLVPDASGQADWELRWFTPAQEIRLCGHATLASGHVLLGRDGGERVTFRTRESGVLEVRRAGGGYELALPTIPVVPGELENAAERLGGPPPQQSWQSESGYHVFLFGDAREVTALDPDFAALTALGDDLFICTAPGAGHPSGADVVSRVFAPGAGVDEDSVTGAAHAVLAPLWAQRLGRDRFTAFQASSRGGRLTCRLNGERVWLGGGCVTVAAGSYFL